MQPEQTVVWRPAVSAPEEYPADINILFFYNEAGAGQHFSLFPVAKAGWGRTSGGVLLADASPEIPTRLYIRWLSFTENRFYEGRFRLDADKIGHLLRTGYAEYRYGKDAGMHEEAPERLSRPYTTLVAGVAPGGVVVVWLSGAASQVEISRFQAAGIQLPMKEFMPHATATGQNGFVRQLMEQPDWAPVRSHLAQNGLQYGLWDQYRKRFLWRPELWADQHDPVLPRSIALDYYNGERELLTHFAQEQPPADRSYPSAMRLLWRCGAAEYQARIHFGWAQVQAAFPTAAGSGAEELLLVVLINRGNDEIRVLLHTAKETTALDGCAFTIGRLAD